MIAAGDCFLHDPLLVVSSFLIVASIDLTALLSSVVYGQRNGFAIS
jgi:hypothetical protein